MNTVSEAVGSKVREGKLFIDGKWVAGSDGEIRPDYNPATGELFAQVHQPAVPMRCVRSMRPTGRRTAGPICWSPSVPRSCSSAPMRSRR